MIGKVTWLGHAHVNVWRIGRQSRKDRLDSVVWVYFIVKLVTPKLKSVASFQRYQDFNKRSQLNTAFLEEYSYPLKVRFSTHKVKGVRILSVASFSNHSDSIWKWAKVNVTWLTLSFGISQSSHIQVLLILKRNLPFSFLINVKFSPSCA